MMLALLDLELPQLSVAINSTVTLPVCPQPFCKPTKSLVILTPEESIANPPPAFLNQLLIKVSSGVVVSQEIVIPVGSDNHSGRVLSGLRVTF